jgi:very-short-patch-repair endonuclease
MRLDIKWNDIQDFYDKNTLDDTLKFFKISKSYFYKGVNLGFLKNRSRSDSVKLALSKLPKRKHSEETKKKISEIRKKFILENPDKAPYKLNHSSKESYPEKYFAELFEKENIKIEKYYPVGLYELDFCIPNKKIDIEINGSQHYYDDKIVKSDIRRTKFLEENGWDVITIKWSDYQKLDFDTKNSYIMELIKYINNLVDTKPTMAIVNKEICICGNKKTKKSINCKSCAKLKQKRKVEIRPSYEELLNEVQKIGYTATGKNYGVSFHTIKKWIKSYENVRNKII